MAVWHGGLARRSGTAVWGGPARRHLYNSNA